VKSSLASGEKESPDAGELMIIRGGEAAGYPNRRIKETVVDEELGTETDQPTAKRFPEGEPGAE
jgi:hypothetical protein